MKTPEGCIRLCDNCPQREFETPAGEPTTGDLITHEPHYLNARLEFVRDASETPDVPTQEYAVRFVDTDGNKTGPFLGGVQLEDIAGCDRPVVIGYEGRIRRKAVYDCGAEAVRMAAFRARLNELRDRR